MKLVLEVPNKYAADVQDFVSRLGTKKQHSITLQTYVGKRAVDLESLQVTRITLDGLPQFAAGDVVENMKSGNWGVVINVENSGLLSIKCSKETAREIGEDHMVCDPIECQKLV